ncbi:DUF4352 domain-containing protein [Metabacillus malikii]|uniref:DUF4352 domain-containing protein n=1 Tax=Metabacillus malikii TaxID=1504265 RepID=A0ABT9ZIF9_9BACI|nr:DUF4352 domain-containing protein [Metabacillus malikii]MDQ0232066.1 hypothetical protein [Metabacillus malikii]
MKKLSVLAILLLAFLAACSSNEEGTTKKADTTTKEVTTEETGVQKESKEVTIDKPFNVITSINPEKATELKMTVSNFEIVQGKSTVQEDNDKYDYAQFDVAIENIGEIEALETVVANYSFKFYNENGVEIEENNYIEQNLQGMTYNEASVRPGGKNEGTIIIPIPKGSEPAEMVYLSNWMSIMGSHEYYFKLK